jgi:hypothetical protein
MQFPNQRNKNEAPNILGLLTLAENSIIFCTNTAKLFGNLEKFFRDIKIGSCTGCALKLCPCSEF